MKKSRFLAFVMSMIMILTALAGCGKDSADVKNKADISANNESASGGEAEIGAVLDKPEKMLNEDIDELYVRFTVTTNDSETKEFEYAMDQITDDMYVMYVTDGLLKVNELVYEVGDNSIQKYCKSALEEKFVLDNTISQSDLRDEVNTNLELVGTLMKGFSAYDTEYHKKSDFNHPFIGDVWTYDVYESGEKIGEIMVDKETGLIASLNSADGDTQIWLEEYKMGGYKIPEYK